MTIEAEYRRVRALTRTHRRENAAEMLSTLLSQARLAVGQSRALRMLEDVRRAQRTRTLRDAVMRMHGDDLDSAWNAALRGDVSLALRRVAVHVREVRQERSGTPWRMTGWLTRR